MNNSWYRYTALRTPTRDAITCTKCEVLTMQMTTAVQIDVRIHDDVIKWKHIPRYWPFVWGIHRSPVNSPHKGQIRGALTFSLICAWINGWVNNREADDLRRHCAHYDVIVMTSCERCWCYLRRPVARMSGISNVITSQHWKTFYIFWHLDGETTLVQWCSLWRYLCRWPKQTVQQSHPRFLRRIILMWSHFNESTTTRIVLITITNQQFTANFKVRKLHALV